MARSNLNETPRENLERQNRAGRLRSQARDKRTEAEKLEAKVGDAATPAQLANSRTADSLRADADRLEAEAERTYSNEEHQGAMDRLRGGGDRDTGRSFGNGSARILARGQSARNLYPDHGVPLADIVRGRAIGDWSGVRPEFVALLSSGVGAAIPGAQVAEVIDIAREQSCVFQAGAQVLVMDGPAVKAARLSSEPAAEIIADTVPGGRILTNGSWTFEAITMDAYSAWLYTTLTIEALEDAVNIDEVITQSFGQQLALALDRYSLAGTGTDEPKGITAMTAGDGIHEVTGVGDLATAGHYTPFIRGVGACRASNYTPNAVMHNVHTWTDLACATETGGQPLQPPPAYAGLAEYVSGSMPNDGGANGESVSLVGDFSKLVIGIRTPATIEVSRTADDVFATGEIAVRAYMRFGVYLKDPAAFCLVEEILNGTGADAPVS